MFEFEDHHFLEEQILKAGEGAVPVHSDHRQRVLFAARHAENRRVQRKALLICCTLFLAFTLLFLTRDSGADRRVASDADSGWSRTLYSKGSRVLGIPDAEPRQPMLQTDWNSVQATLKQSGEWGLVDAVVRFRNERAGSIEQIFIRGD
ncbi:hypothetical protein [Gimesia panareensis]|uniref:Uncharacterized protein n=1 Tax=Gimesia panareensis TaxID=2527978 RepID=A0A518FGK6_9PLAN|nr:hypothetical protein [Gimesia panareensis]QDT24823.1 hypothetical protein Enr10x_01150 [Gimesia panareensis]QDU47768.1 hypothetical protein Pan110_00780 [Gimesia panareensis]QDV15476.1 hypothetical protein Pan153_00900 [Gimesia panareensis]